MESIQNKIDFAAIVVVDGANPNGDPLNGNRPRTTVDGLGEISDVCLKRKIRNRLQDMGCKVFVQSADRADDGMDSLRERADAILKQHSKDSDGLTKAACAEWIDVRAFGQLFAFKGKGAEGVSVGIRGPVTIRPAFSASPVNVSSIQITKSVNSESGDKRGSDTMGMKYRVDHGVYTMYGSINPQLAQKTGFSQEDAEVFKKAIRTLFENDGSSARPEGSMDIYRVYWWQHNCSSGQYSSARVHSSLKVTPKVDMPRSIDDYDIVVDELDDLRPEIL